MRNGIPHASLATRSFFALCALFLCVVTAFAQMAGRGTISGTVTDPSGAAVPATKVVLVNTATGVTQRTVTNSAGLYVFNSLNPGEYQVTASRSGFARVALNNVTVTVDKLTLANIALKVGAASETVNVTSTSNLIAATNSTVGTLLGRTAIANVPLLYRNTLDLVQLSPGVIPPNGSPNSQDSMMDIENISIGRPGISVSSATVNGSIVASVYYMLDGSPLGIAEDNIAAIMPAMDPPEDGVDEVQVETQNTPASYQSGAAGVISMVSNSGTNKLHGDAFADFRPNALSANEYFNKLTQLENSEPNTPPSFHRYQEGGAIGGAIKKDKLFYFADFETTQQEDYEGIDYFAVPTTAERTGDFSAMSFNIYDPTQPDLSDGTRQPFAGNIISNPNPIGKLFLSEMPACNLPSPTACQNATTDNPYNYGIPGMDPYSEYAFDIRVDWAESEKQHLFTRFSFDRLHEATADVFPSGWDPNYAENFTNGRNVIVGDDLTLNPTTFLQLRYSFTRHYENQGNPAFSNNNITSQGFPSSLASEVDLKNLPIMNFSDVGGGVGGTSDSNLFQFASEDSDANVGIVKVLGRHQISVGFEWMKRYLNSGITSAPDGLYSFDISATDQTVSSETGGSDYASLLLGMGEEPGFEEENFQQFFLGAMSNPYYGAYIEDTYRPSNTITITAGLRWDIFGGENERHNRLEYFNPTISNTYEGVSYTGAEIFVNNSNRSPYTTTLDNIGPRLSVAWQPFANFVVRGGAGIYYGPATSMVHNASLNSDGFSEYTNWESTCYNADGNTTYYSSTCATPTPDNFTAPYSLSNPFPTGLVSTFTSAPPGLTNNLETTLNTVPHSPRVPTVYNFNLNVEYAFPHQVVATIGFVGSRGLYLPFSSVDLNQLTLAQIQQYNSSLCVAPGSSCVYKPNQWDAITPPTNANYGLSTVPLWAAIEQFPQFGNGSYGAGNGVNLQGAPVGDSEYDSLQAKLQKQLAGGFTALGSFTWGKIMTDDTYPPDGFVGNHYGSVQDWKDLSYEHSVSPQDVRFMFSGELSYQLPIGKGLRVNLHGFANQALGGWIVDMIGFLSSGNPINAPSSGTTPSYFNQRSDMTCNPAAHAPHTVNDWFNDSCFAIPGTENGGVANPFVPGTAPDYLDNVRTDGARDLDVSIHKVFALGGARALNIKASAYNISNTPQFGYPSVPSVVGAIQQSLPFGQITNTNNTPRQFQFGSRFTF